MDDKSNHLDEYLKLSSSAEIGLGIAKGKCMENWVTKKADQNLYEQKKLKRKSVLIRKYAWPDSNRRPMD